MVRAGFRVMLFHRRGTKKATKGKVANQRASVFPSRFPLIFVSILGAFAASWSFHVPYFLRIFSRNCLLSAVTSHAFGQKHRSTHHQSLGTADSLMTGSSLSKSSLPVPNGLCVLVWCSLREPSESIKWTCVILPLSFCSNSRAPPGSVSF